MGLAHFKHADFLDAARALAAELGPAGVTVDLVNERLKAPKGSFYYRFASRDLLLGELWLTAALAYQEGFVAAIEAGDGLKAALHMPAWVRLNLDDARLLLLYSRHDFVQGEWPLPLKKAVADQARRFETCLERFAREALGSAKAENIRVAQFVLADVPMAAVRPHLRRREAPPLLIDELIRDTYRAIVDKDRAPPSRRLRKDAASPARRPRR
jgi:AcrR family transcriptional regulator